MNKIGELFRIQSKKFIALTIISVLMILFVLILKGFDMLSSYVDAFFISGFFMIGLGGLSFVTQSGAFDSFGYSGYYIFQKFKAGEARKYEHYQDYIETKRSQRTHKKYTYWPYFIVGIIPFIISVILYFNL